MALATFSFLKNHPIRPNGESGPSCWYLRELVNGKAVDNFQNGRPFTNRRRREAATHVHKRQKNRGVGLLFLCRIIESRNSSLASFPLPTDRRLFGDTGLDGGGHSAVVTGRLSRTRNGEKIGKEIFGGKKRKKKKSNCVWPPAEITFQLSKQKQVARNRGKWALTPEIQLIDKNIQALYTLWKKPEKILSQWIFGISLFFSPSWKKFHFFSFSASFRADLWTDRA